ncbi:MAG: hypothetical protein HKM86_01290, partial [Deltaproteobacteria bacterium]|nr:hypothetical protein [Deltaproteobacteria bacterium]
MVKMECRRFPRRGLAILAVLFAFACSDANDASLSVRLTYPQESAAAGTGYARAVGMVRPAYVKAPENRILIRVLAPHIATPIEAWFDRSQGRGEISGIPPGDRIAVEVDEYDNTALTLGTNAPLLGRGFTHGVTLDAGENRTVIIPMYDRGTIIRICGAAPSGGAGTAGDSGDGGLAVDALLGQPLAMEVGPDDAIYVSSAQFNRIRRIDRYGYITHYAGNGPSGMLLEGELAATAPIGPVYDLDTGPSGDLYLITWDQQILRINQSTGALSIRYDDQKGIFNPAAKPDLAVVDDDTIYYTNGMENRVYLVQGGVRSDYVADNTPSQTQEGADKDFYPLRYPASVTTVPSGLSVFFCDRDNNKVKFVATSSSDIFTLIGSSTVVPFTDGMPPLSMTPELPVMIKFDRVYGNYFLHERDFYGIRVLRPSNRVYNFAGTGSIGYAGDGGGATSALMHDPLS